jgi:formamidopyrimidine-DNA glycosylase
MPELPEVETIRRRLEPALVGKMIRALAVADATVSAQPAAELRRLAVGGTVTGVRRRGKYLIVDLDRGILVVHLRMTGQLLLARSPEPRLPRFTIDFDDGSALFFYDVRRFGRLWAFRDEAELEHFFAELGVEPLSPGFSVARLRALLDARRAPLKAFLLDQRRIAGVGNIYADEALFRAGLHPLRPAGSVGARGAARLRDALVETLELGIAQAGSSVDSFVDPEGAPGSFQETLNVYQRTGEPCRRCGTPVERVVVGGRGTHFCPRCQPRRRMGHLAAERASRTLASPTAR